MARRARPLGATHGRVLRRRKAGPGDKRRHLCHSGPGCITTRLHSHVKGSTAHPGHTLPAPHFSHSLWCSPSIFSLQVASKDLVSHSAVSPPPFLPGPPRCQHISTAPPWPHKCHNTVTFRFSYSHPHISSCHQQAWEKPHRIM